MLAILLVAAIISPVVAAKQANNVYLYEKNPADWTIVPDGAWGKLNYLPDQFVFNGHGLEAGVEYALVYYPDPWPGTGLMVLGSGTANNGGNVHIAGDFDFSLIPIVGDTNTPGAKIWLVLAADQDGNQMTGWNPTEYLFENNLI